MAQQHAALRGSDLVIIFRFVIHFVIGLRQRIKPDPEEPCPLRLSHGFQTAFPKRKKMKKARQLLTPASISLISLS
jgi:hypothetical protein